jgi:hypothetical protein
VPATTTTETPSATTSSVVPPVAAPPVVEAAPATPPVVETPAEELSALEQLRAQKSVVEEPPKVEAPVVPQEYEIEFSDKSPLTETDMDNIVAMAEKHNWTKEEAEAHIAEREQLYNRGFQDLKAQATKIVNAEKEKLMADPDFKGEKLITSLETIDLVVNKYGSPELAAYLKGPGGNSLALSKMLLTVGKLMKQDTMPSNSKGLGPKSEVGDSREAMLERSYPHFFKKA